MPRVKIDYVVSFSSEDPEHPASNLLNREVSKKKWLCKKGEPSSSVVLQLARAVKISAVHIGAYHAALVEVLVGRSETPSEQFQVLVPSSVLLSREESRRAAGVSRVRSFGGAQLGAARSQRWDRVRVVCSQPHNKHTQYGLSFVHIDESEEATDGSCVTNGVKPSSASEGGAVPRRLLTLDTYSSDEDEFKPGELFAKHLQNTNENQASSSTNTGAQIRQATSQALKNISESSTRLMKTPISKPSSKRDCPAIEHSADRSRHTLLYTRDDDAPHARIDNVLRHHKDEARDTRDTTPHTARDTQDTTRPAARDSRDTTRHVARETRDTTRHTAQDTRDTTRQTARDTNDTTRQTARNTSDTTRKTAHKATHHLQSTPNRPQSESEPPSRQDPPRTKPHTSNDTPASEHKDKQVNKRTRSDTQEQLVAGPVSSAPHALLRGAVVVLSGYQNPRRAQLRSVAAALGAQLRSDWGPDCTHLICAFPNTPKLRAARAARAARGGDVAAARAEWLEQCARRRRLLPWQWFASEPAHHVPPPEGEEDDLNDHSEDDDTDDEIEKVLQNQKKRRPTEADTSNSQGARDVSPVSGGGASPAPYDARTDDEAPPPPARGGGALPAFLSGRTFCVDAEPDSARQMERYIQAYGGLVLQMSDVEEGSSVDYIVRGRSGKCARGPNVTPAWLARCHAARALLPRDS